MITNRSLKRAITGICMVVLPAITYAQTVTIQNDTLKANNLAVKGVLDLGLGQPGREPNAGKLGYSTFDNGSLCIVGAGQRGDNRRISLWSEGGAKLSGGINITGRVAIGYGDWNRQPTAALQVNGRIKDVAGIVTPVGGIMMYSGGFSGNFDGNGLGISGTDVEGWAVCNGQNGTPDLRGKFIVAAGPNSYNVNDQGGNNTHQLTVAELPSHTHNYVKAVWGGGNQGANNGGSWGSNANNQASDATGSNQAFDTRPPYYALLYIMKK